MKKENVNNENNIKILSLAIENMRITPEYDGGYSFEDDFLDKVQHEANKISCSYVMKEEVDAVLLAICKTSNNA